MSIKNFVLDVTPAPSLSLRAMTGSLLREKGTRFLLLDDAYSKEANELFKNQNTISIKDIVTSDLLLTADIISDEEALKALVTAYFEVGRLNHLQMNKNSLEATLKLLLAASSNSKKGILIKLRSWHNKSDSALINELKSLKLNEVNNLQDSDKKFLKSFTAVAIDHIDVLRNILDFFYSCHELYLTPRTIAQPQDWLNKDLIVWIPCSMLDSSKYFLLLSFFAMALQTVKVYLDSPTPSAILRQALNVGFSVDFVSINNSYKFNLAASMAISAQHFYASLQADTQSFFLAWLSHQDRQFIYTNHFSSQQLEHFIRNSNYSTWLGTYLTYHKGSLQVLQMPADLKSKIIIKPLAIKNIQAISVKTASTSPVIKHASSVAESSVNNIQIMQKQHALLEGLQKQNSQLLEKVSNLTDIVSAFQKEIQEISQASSQQNGDVRFDGNLNWSDPIAANVEKEYDFHLEQQAKNKNDAENGKEDLSKLIDS